MIFGGFQYLHIKPGDSAINLGEEFGIFQSASLGGFNRCFSKVDAHNCEAIRVLGDKFAHARSHDMVARAAPGCPDIDDDDPSCYLGIIVRNESAAHIDEGPWEGFADGRHWRDPERCGFASSRVSPPHRFVVGGFAKRHVAGCLLVFQSD